MRNNEDQLDIQTPDSDIPPVVVDKTPDEGQVLGESGDIEVVDGDPVEVIPTEPIEIAPYEEVTVHQEPDADRIVRAVQVLGDVVDNVLMVAVDKENNVVGYPLPYGYELIVVEDDSPIGTGWIRIDGEFVNPEAE